MLEEPSRNLLIFFISSKWLLTWQSPLLSSDQSKAVVILFSSWMVQRWVLRVFGSLCCLVFSSQVFTTLANRKGWREWLKNWNVHSITFLPSNGHVHPFRICNCLVGVVLKDSPAWRSSLRTSDEDQCLLLSCASSKTEKSGWLDCSHDLFFSPLSLFLTTKIELLIQAMLILLVRKCVSLLRSPLIPQELRSFHSKRRATIRYHWAFHREATEKGKKH